MTLLPDPLSHCLVGFLKAQSFNKIGGEDEKTLRKSFALPDPS
jgi:hypothetical protein